MFDKRLFSLTPGIKRLVAAKVVCLWVSLLADIGFAYVLVGLLGNILGYVEPLDASKCTQLNAIGRCLNPAQTQGDSALESGKHALSAYPDNYGMFILFIAVIVVVKYVATRCSAYFGTRASESVKLALREKLYRKMLQLGPSYAQRVRTSDVVQSAGEGIEQIQSFFELFLPQLFYSILAPITLFIFVVPVNWPAALVLLVCAPLIVIIVGLVAMSASRVFKKYWGKYTDMGAAFLDDLQGLETLKTFDADGRAAEDMNRKAEEFRVMTMRVLQIQLRSLSAMDLVAYGGTAAGIGVAIWQFMIGQIWLPAALVVALLSASFFLPLRQLGSYFHVAMNGMTSTKRIFALLDAPVPHHGSIRLPSVADSVSVTFDHVGFAYGSGDDQKIALHDVDFSAQPGQLTAIVGVSGSGKSTAAGLLGGSLVGYDGSIRLGYSLLGTSADVELSDVAEQSLMGAVTVVSARSHLFAGTLRQNLVMAKPGATDNDLWVALHQARIDDFVCAQPGGLDMKIEQDAANLSGGQRQRFAIARALLRDSAIYVFDEATSSVDVESENRILATIRDLADRKTVLMITHRVANAVLADQIVVFDHGTVAQTGQHDALVVADGVYAKLFRAQAVFEHVSHRDDARMMVGSEQMRQLAGTGSRAAASGASALSMGDTSQSTSQSAAESVSAASSTDTVANANSADTSSDDAPGTASAAGDMPDKRSGSMSLIGRLLGEVRPLSLYMVQACLYGTIGHLSATFLPVFGVCALFAHLGHPVWGLSSRTAVICMVACGVLRGIMRYAEQYMNHNVAFRLLALFRSKAFAALRRLAPAKLAGKGKGDLISLITTDVELLEIFFAHTISPVVIAVVTTVVFAVAAFTLDPWFALLLVVSHLIVGVLLPRRFAASVRTLGPKIRKYSAQLDDVMLDDMHGLDEIIRFGQGSKRLGNIVSRTRRLWSERSRLSRRTGRFTAIGGLLVIAATVGAVMVALRVSQGNPFSIPNAVVAVVLIASSFGPTLALSALPANLTQTFASARRLFALLDEQPAVVETGTDKPEYDGMSFEHVDFSYRPDQPILCNLSLAVPKTGILGIQGPSGRGKSTVLKLLMRYWDPKRGQVRFSGVPLPQVDAAYRRRVQTMMSQETYLFDGSIAQNLRIADEHASDEQLREALRKASVLDLVDSLPDGLDTQVGELGGRLSEGERQRIGLARVFLRKADLVLFDEPTSRLDALNEAVILTSINQMAAERDVAIVLVSHRQSTMRVADVVVRV
ncbi:ATP-binding cassette domain-containing protein [Bifidobacterium porcinum]|uniref:ATP-binding cassette domain-containing protein n=1 Tax=Bifidobacterium porcinum TaxID=212365 RepID=UPI003992BEC3